MTAHSERLRPQLVAALKAHLASGSKPVVLEAGELLWLAFGELSATRTTGFAGPNPITYAEIEAWARLNRWPLQPHHVAVIRALDDAFIEHVYAQRPGVPGGKVALRSSGHAVNPAAFDAVFG